MTWLLLQGLIYHPGNLTYPLFKGILKMIILLLRWDMWSFPDPSYTQKLDHWLNASIFGFQYVLSSCFFLIPPPKFHWICWKWCYQIHPKNILDINGWHVFALKSPQGSWFMRLTQTLYAIAPRLPHLGTVDVAQNLDSKCLKQNWRP